MEPAGARRVLDHDGRAARNVLRQVPRQDARLGVDVAADAVVDEQGEGLALVELRDGRGRGQDRDDRDRCGHGKRAFGHDWSIEIVARLKAVYARLRGLWSVAQCGAAAPRGTCSRSSRW